MSRFVVVGLGKLGSPLAAVLAGVGDVVGTDTNPDYVAAINAGEAPVEEPDLANLIATNRERLCATSDIAEAVAAGEVIFVVVPTPSTPEGDFDTSYVAVAMTEIGRGMRDTKRFQLIVLVSTVCPGVMDAVVKPILERESGKRCGGGVGFGLCYNPEFIALGSVIRNMLNPDFILIGESDGSSGDLLQGIYNRVCPDCPPIKRMSFVNAEISKLALNTYVTTKISYANMLGAICERIPGADAAVVTDALGCDRRIGPYYLSPATAYGGPCFVRDNRALAAVGRKVGVTPLIALATDKTNEDVRNLFVNNILTIAGRSHGAVGILGLAYKPDTPVIEESTAIYLAAQLTKWNIPVIVYDSLAMDNARGVLGDGVRYADSVEACVEAADVIVITTPCREFAQICAMPIAWGYRRRTIVDPWRLLNRETIGPFADYVTPGGFQ